MKLNHKGSLITFNTDSGEQLLGYLIHSEEHGTFEPSLGKVDVTKEEAEIHNSELAKAELSGLDQNCKVGQGGTFYYEAGKVSTFTGVIVSEDVRTKGKTIEFSRNGKNFRGRMQKDATCFNFKRIS